MKKLLNQALYFRILVLEQQSHIAHITFDLDHIIKRQMSDHSQGSLPHLWILLMQILIEILVVRLNDVGEAMKKVTHCDDYVVLDD